MGLHNEIGQSDDYRLNRRRDAHRQELLADGFVQPHLPQTEPVFGFHNAQVPHGQKRRQPLGTGGGQSSALYTPIQKVDKYGISQQVGNAAKKLVKHGRPGVPQRPQNPGADVVADNGDKAQQVQPQVANSAGQYLLRCPHPSQAHGSHQQPQHCEHQSQQAGHSRCGADNVLQLSGISAAHGFGGRNADTDAQSRKDTQNAGHDQTAGTHRSGGVRSQNPTHEHQIHRVVQ